MKIAGLQKISFNEYPHKLCAIVFTQGCNLRCPFCYNSELVYPNINNNYISENSIFDFLRNRINKLEAVTITGGEPTIQTGLLPFLTTIQSLGFAIKINTNGTKPEIIQKLISSQLVDYVSMDIKAPFEKYDLLAGVPVDLHAIKQSISIIQSSGITHDFRTTVEKSLLTLDDLKIIHTYTKDSSYILQPFFYSEKILEPKFLEYEQHTKKELEELQKLVHCPRLKIKTNKKKKQELVHSPL